MHYFKIKIKSNECFCDSHRKEFWEEFYRQDLFSSIRSNKLPIELERHENGPVFLLLFHELVNNPIFIGVAANFIYDFMKLLVKTDKMKNNSIHYEISFRKENHKTKEFIDSSIKFTADNIPNANLIIEEINKSIKDLNN